MPKTNGNNDANKSAPPTLGASTSHANNNTSLMPTRRLGFINTNLTEDIKVAYTEAIKNVRTLFWGL